MAYEAIAATTLSSAQQTITFSSIPSTYEHLQLRCFTRLDIAASVSAAFCIRFNNDSGTNYVEHRMIGDGSTASGTGSTSPGGTSIQFGIVTGATANANVFGVTICDILDYASTNKYKTIRAITGNDNNGSGQTAETSGAWLSTSAINRIDVGRLVSTITMVAGTVIALYGLKSA